MPLDADVVLDGITRIISTPGVEGLVLRPYLDSVGVPTIGRGTTIYPNGVRVTLADPAITVRIADMYVRDHLTRRTLPAVLRLCPTLQTTPHLIAIGDWTYNLGENNLKNSTLRQKILKRDWAAVPTEIARWVYGGGRELPGLRRRRALEIAAWQGA
jgi:lysozyme